MQSDLNNVFPDLYYIQLTEGCISIRCNHPQCKSSPNFIYSSETNDSLREKANAFAINHQHENLLCPNFPVTLYDFSIFEDVILFNDFISNFIRHRSVQNTAKIVSIISNIRSYPFLFSDDLNEIDFYSIHPPPELIEDFIVAEKSNAKDLQFLRQSHNDMVTLLIRNTPEAIKQIDSLYHLRAIYISFLFYSLFSENQALLFDLIKHTMSLLPDSHSLLSDMISKSPLFIEELNSVIQNALSDYITKKTKKIDETTWNVAKFIQFILVPANDRSSKPIPYHLFANSQISKKFLAKIELRKYLSNHPTFIHTPSLITLIKKSRLIPEGNIKTTSTKSNRNLTLLEIDSSFKLEDFKMGRDSDDSFGIEEEDFEEEEEEAEEEEEEENEDDDDDEKEEEEKDDENEEEEEIDFHIHRNRSSSSNANTNINSPRSRRGRFHFLSRLFRFRSNTNTNTNTNSNSNANTNSNSNTNSNTNTNESRTRQPIVLSGSGSSSSSSSSSSEDNDDDDDEINIHINRHFDSLSDGNDDDDDDDFSDDDDDSGSSRGILKFTVRRNHLLDDTLVALLTADKKDLMGRVKVRFKGEEAYDAGGVSREFFTVVTSTLFSPDYGMFELIDDRFYWFRSSGDNTDLLRYFKLLGAFIGIAINNKVILPIRFPLIMYKKLLNYKNSIFDISDFAEIDPAVAQSLTSLLESKEKGENVEDSGLMFDFSFEYFDTIQTKELIENGSNIPVTNDNVDEYVQEVINWKLNKSIEKQFLAFKEGFDMNCDTPIMKIFAPIELEELVSGLKQLDWEAFKKNVKYSGYNKNSQTIKDLWNIMDNEWNEKQKIDFLYFITGIRTAPVGGLGQLNISIQKDKNSDQIPTSHTCFNELNLPNYKNIDVLRKKINICLENCEGFGLV